MRPLLFSTACLPGRLPLDQRVAQLLEAGAFGIELGQGVTVTDDFAWNTLRPLSSTWAIHNYFPPPKKDFLLNLAQGASKPENQSLNFCRQALDVAHSLGAGIYSVHGGFRANIPVQELGKPIGARDCLSQQEAFDNLVSALSILLKKAEKYQIQILIEPNVVAGFNFTEDVRDQLMMVSSQELLMLMQSLAHPLLGVLIDLGHLKVTAQVLRFDPIEYIDALEPYIRGFHYHDNDGHTDQHRFSLPEGWMKEILNRKSLRHLPVIVESHFADVEELSRSRIELENALL